MSIVNMAGTSIKFFHFTQKLCEFCGIYSLKPNQNRYHMNSINWFEIFCLNQYFISTAIFLFFGAKSMAEYGKTSYLCLTTVVCDIFCLTALQQAENIPKFVGNWEAFVEKSKCQMTMDLFVCFYLIRSFCAIDRRTIDERVQRCK